LADYFEEDYAGGYGNVKRADGAAGGNRNQEIAAFAGKLVQAFAFTAENNSDLT
jgi:hypothetical protein